MFILFEKNMANRIIKNNDKSLKKISFKKPKPRF